MLKGFVFAISPNGRLEILFMDVLKSSSSSIFTRRPGRIQPLQVIFVGSGRRSSPMHHDKGQTLRPSLCVREDERPPFSNLSNLFAATVLPDAGNLAEQIIEPTKPVSSIDHWAHQPRMFCLCYRFFYFRKKPGRRKHCSQDGTRPTRTIVSVLAQPFQDPSRSCRRSGHYRICLSQRPAIAQPIHRLDLELQY